MSAPASRRNALLALIACAAMTPGVAPAAPAPVMQRGHYLVQVIAEQAVVRAGPDAAQPVIGRIEQGTELEATGRSGAWYRVQLSDGRVGWLQDEATPHGATLAVRPFPGAAHLERAPAAGAETVARQRPQGEPLEPRLPVIDPSRVPPPQRYVERKELPVRDRWRIAKSLGLLPYNRWDPYHPNELKGDLPVLEKALGKDWFFNLAAVSDTLLEARRLPVPVGAQSSRRAGSNDTLGRGRQTVLAETAVLSLSLVKGNTTFRPPDYEFRFVPVVNVNRVIAEEVRALNIDPAAGAYRDDHYVGVQELFFDKHLRDVSVRYDFDSVRIGVQPFNADFRGFLFLDQPLGVRVFGTRDNNQWQYNLAWFRRLEKDTNSGLNSLGERPRADDVFVANLYRQDLFVPGFTGEGIVLHNRNREGGRTAYYDANGFLQRPAIFGTGRAHDYDVTYVGLNGDGHFGRWNVSASGYRALGRDSRGMLSGVSERIDATFGAIEVSRDFDWIRVRASGLYASGDRNPFDGKAGGYDAVLENPLFAGADTSYWIRQAVPLIGGGGVALSMRNGILPALRTSREHGQSNFTNPGVRMIGLGADLDVAPRVRVIANVSRLAFDNLSSLATLRNQRLTSSDIGTDYSLGVQYRPLYTQNIVVNASVAVLQPGGALRQLYGSAVDARQYSALVNVLLTF